MKHKYIIIGPQAPAIGGIATIVELLKTHISANSGTKFVNTIKPQEGVLKVLRPIKLLAKVVSSGINSDKGNALMFSSSYGSFWEKCIWSCILKIFGVRTIVYMVAGDFPTFFRRLNPFKKAIARLLVKSIDIIGVQSRTWEIFYSKIFPDSEVRILSPGIDTNMFYPSAQLTESPDLLYMGWLIKDKGIYDLIDALALVAEKNVNFKANLVGPAFGAEEEILGYASEKGIVGNINLVGGLSNKEEVISYYRSSQIFIFPSHFEGFPYSVMEAVSSGLPSIATRVGGIPDILDDGKCGVLVDPKSPEQLAQAIEQLLTDSSKRKKMSQDARTHAVENYSISRSIDDFKKILGISNSKY